MVAAPDKTYSEVELKAAVYVRRLICAEQGKNDNKNKYWSGFVLPDGTYVAEWGRVGVTKQQQNKACGSVDAAKRMVDKKAEDKLGRSGSDVYTELKYVEGSAAAVTGSGGSVKGAGLAKLARDQIAGGDPIVSSLIDFFAKVNRHTILANTKLAYDESAGTFRTPLGVLVTQEAIDDARHLLDDISDVVAARQWDSPKMFDLMNGYMRLIPMNIGMKRLEPRNVLPDLKAVRQQGDILDSLAASLTQAMTPVAATTAAVADVPKVFSVKLTPITEGKRIDALRKLYQSTRLDMHVCAHLDVKTAYDVQIDSSTAAFERDGKKVGGVVEAWHGTNAANVLSILKGGLVVPPSSSPHVCGRMFGDGVYGAIHSTKSLNYAYGYWDGTRNERCFMFRMDMAMGKYYVPRGSGSTRPSGYDSIWAKRGQSGVANDELITPRASQCNLKQLLEFTPHGK